MMATVPLPEAYMLPAALAKRMGKSVEWVCDELRRDSERDVKQYPFAIATQNKETGTWAYRIHKRRFEQWENGTLFEPEQLAALVAARVVEQLREAAMRSCVPWPL